MTKIRCITVITHYWSLYSLIKCLKLQEDDDWDRNEDAQKENPLMVQKAMVQRMFALALPPVVLLYSSPASLASDCMSLELTNCLIRNVTSEESVVDATEELLSVRESVLSCLCFSFSVHDLISG